MRKNHTMQLVLLLCMLVFLAGCTSVTGMPSSGNASAKPSTTTAGETYSPSAAVTDGPVETHSSPIIHPEQVLTAEEASAILGLPVTIENGSNNVDKEHGISSLRYAYTLSEMTDAVALVQIEQDGLKPAEDLADGLTARSSYDFQAKLLKDEIEPVEDMGDEAFIMKTDGQLFMAYRGYFVVVAFTVDEYDSTKNAPFNIALGRKILENMQRMLDK